MNFKISGSHISAIAGLNPWRSPIDAYLAIREGVEVTETPAMRWGNKLERLVAHEFAEQTGQTGLFLWPSNDTGIPREMSLQHKLIPWWAGTPDRLIILDQDRVTDDDIMIEVMLGNEGFWEQVVGVLEIKTTGFRSATDWENGPPEWVKAQAAWYQGIVRSMNRQAAWRYWIAVLIGGQDYRQYEIALTNEYLSFLFDMAQCFMINHLLPGIPPEPDASKSWDEYFRRKCPSNEPGVYLLANEKLNMLVADLLAKRQELSQTETAVRAIENRLKLYIGEAEGLRADLATITWKKSKDRQVIDWQSAFEAMVDYARQYNLPEVADEIIAQHTEVKPGSRVFKIKEGGNGND